MLAAKPTTSPVIPPPREIIQSFLVKLLANNILIILLTEFKFLFFSLESNR